MDPGTLCCWKEGGALAIPFGPTPISKAGECRLAARVGVLGSVAGDPRILKVVRPGEALKIERLMA